MTGALRTSEQARTLADRIGRPELSSQLLRTWGLALAQAGQPAEAEQRLREAVAAAGPGQDSEMPGRGQDKNFNVKAGLRRAPAGDEPERLNRVVQGATVEFRHRLTSAPCAS
jgi:hypothetical protein